MSNFIEKIDNTFTDAEDFAKEIRMGEAEQYQLEPGNFEGRLTQVLSQKVMVSVYSFNRMLIQSGKVLPGYTVFLLPGNMEQDFSWRKTRLSGKRIGLLKEEMNHFTILPSNFFGTPIALHNNFLKELILKKKLIHSIYGVIQQNEGLEILAEDAHKLQKLVIELCYSSKPDWSLLENDLPTLLLDSLDRVLEEIPHQISRSRDILFHHACIFINQNLNSKINTKSLCDYLETSERTLRYLFTELVGLTPMKFVKNLRLNKTRKDIKNSDNNTKISVIANKWGFSHSGQFAADYKKLLGEFPNETVRKKIDDETGE